MRVARGRVGDARDPTGGTGAVAPNRFVDASWDDALDVVASRLLAIRREHGPGSIAFYISGQLLTKDYYAVNKLAKQVHAATGGFITGPSEIDGVAMAIRRAHGSTNGLVLAKIMEKFRDVPTISGNVSSSNFLSRMISRWA